MPAQSPDAAPLPRSSPGTHLRPQCPVLPRPADLAHPRPATPEPGPAAHPRRGGSGGGSRDSGRRGSTASSTGEGAQTTPRRSSTARQGMPSPSGLGRRRASGEGQPNRAMAGSALCYAKCKLEMDRRRAAAHRGTPRPRPRAASQAATVPPAAAPPSPSAARPSAASPSNLFAIAHTPTSMGSNGTPRGGGGAGCAGQGGPAGPSPGALARVAARRAAPAGEPEPWPSPPSRGGSLSSTLYGSSNSLHSGTHSIPLSSPAITPRDSEGTQTPPEQGLGPARRPSNECEPGLLQRRRLPRCHDRLATAASFAMKLSTALDEEDLAVPWRETEKLTKLTSCMLRMGLRYELSSPGPDCRRPSASPPPTPPPGPRHGPAPFPGAEGGDAEANPRLRAVLRHELQRQQELAERIEQRDRRREWARRQAEDQRQREVAALRAAMWLTIVKQIAHTVPHVMVARLQASRLSRCVLPMWRRFVYRSKLRQARQRLLQDVAPRTPRLTPHQLRGTGPLFQDWPEELLAAFAGELQLCPFAEGEYICHQGDPSSLLYVLVAGEVDVVLRRPDSTAKARGKRTGLTVARLTPGRYVGEYGVFAGEPRAATLYCATPVVAWVARRDRLVQCLQQLPLPVYRAISAGFEANMAHIYPVRPAQLASTVLFRGWDLPTLEEVVDRLQPVLFPEGAVILEAGAPGAAVFAVAKGRCHVAPGGLAPPAPAAELAAGALLGLRACLFLEGQEHEVRALTTVQAWRLPKAALMDFLLRRPDRFLAAKQRLNAELAKALAKPLPAELFADSCLAAVPCKVQRELYGRLQPIVVGATDPLMERGDPVDCLWFGVSGRCAVDGVPLPPGAAPCLGQDPPGHRVAHWPHTVTALERVTAWRLPLPDVAAALERKPSLPGPLAQRRSLASATLLG